MTLAKEGTARQSSSSPSISTAPAFAAADCESARKALAFGSVIVKPLQASHDMSDSSTNKLSHNAQAPFFHDEGNFSLASLQQPSYHFPLWYHFLGPIILEPTAPRLTTNQPPMQHATENNHENIPQPQAPSVRGLTAAVAIQHQPEHPHGARPWHLDSRHNSPSHFEQDISGWANTVPEPHAASPCCLTLLPPLTRALPTSARPHLGSPSAMIPNIRNRAVEPHQSWSIRSSGNIEAANTSLSLTSEAQSSQSRSNITNNGIFKTNNVNYTGPMPPSPTSTISAVPTVSSPSFTSYTEAELEAANTLLFLASGGHGTQSTPMVTIDHIEDTTEAAPESSTRDAE